VMPRDAPVVHGDTVTADSATMSTTTQLRTSSLTLGTTLNSAPGAATTTLTSTVIHRRVARRKALQGGGRRARAAAAAVGSVRWLQQTGLAKAQPQLLALRTRRREVACRAVVWCAVVWV
jgi:hypothetical protein